MSRQHLIRLGLLGHVGRFRSVDGRTYPRASRVICRTTRGLEVGQVLNPSGDGRPESDGELVRAMTVEDELLLARLEKNRDEAVRACQTLLAERGLTAVLMDVEHLFDGGSLYFYFLGEISPQVEEVVAQLSEAYEAKAQLRQFAETLTAGCGPGCGTDEGAGCGTAESGCATCAVAGACATQAKR